MKKALVVVVALAAIGYAVYTFVPRGGKATAEMEGRPRVCEKCNHRFVGPTDDILLECPKCKERAGVRVHVYECHKCQNTFDAFWSKPEDASLTTIDPMKPPPKVLYKVGDGDWTASWTRTKQKLKCPKCGSKDIGPPLPR